MYLTSDSATLNTHNLILRESDPALATLPAVRAALTHVTVPVLEHRESVPAAPVIF